MCAPSSTRFWATTASSAGNGSSSATTSCATTACSTARPPTTSSAGCWRRRGYRSTSGRTRRSHDRFLRRQPWICDRCADAPVPLVPDDRLLVGIWEWERTYRFRSGKWALADYNFETPSTHLQSRKKTVNPCSKSDALENVRLPWPLRNSHRRYADQAADRVRGGGLSGNHRQEQLRLVSRPGPASNCPMPTQPDADQEFLITEVQSQRRGLEPGDQRGARPSTPTASAASHARCPTGRR